MAETVLVTGGAGFIGRAVCKELLRRGNEVRVLDSLIEQVHGDCERPEDLPQDVELIRGDIRNKDVVTRSLKGVDSVINLAAEVGVGQSMYAVERYTSVNEVGGAVLFEALIDSPVRRVVTASSMSIYGEGLYRDADGNLVQNAERQPRKSEAQSWDPLDAQGRPLSPVGTPEWKQPSLASIYALGKYVQERQTLIMTQAYGMEGTCLRLFNVYGPGQALSNPYTGVLAIFSSRLSNGQRPMIFEDGEQRRDFVYVGDVARAFCDALVDPNAVGEVFNIGSGNDRSVREVAQSIARAMHKNDMEPEIVGKSRIGDIRHCFCDGSKAEEKLGFRAEKDFDEGLAELSEWVAEQSADDRVDQARAELEARGLVGMNRGDNRPILITGGAGFIGSNLADRLAGQGEQVIVFDALSRPGVERNLSWLKDRHGARIASVIADIRDEDEVVRAAAEAKAIFHLAAQVAVTTSMADPREDFEINIRGTVNVLDAVRTRGEKVPVIFASTNKVYGDLADLPFETVGNRHTPVGPVAERGIDERRPLDFHTPYGCSKGAADQYVLDYCRSFGIPTAVFRMSCIYGQRQMGTEDQGWVAHFLIRALEGKAITLYGDGRQVRDILDVSDAVDAYVGALKHIDQVQGRAFNLGGGPANSVSLLQLLDEIGHITGLEVEVSFENWRPGDQRWYVSDARAAQATLGLSAPRPWRDGVAALAEWLANERGLQFTREPLVSAAE